MYLFDGHKARLFFPVFLDQSHGLQSIYDLVPSKASLSNLLWEHWDGDGSPYSECSVSVVSLFTKPSLQDVLSCWGGFKNK